MNGLLLVDKPLSWTSHDVVAKVRGILKQADPANSKVKVGHTGTLDPAATGLLVLVVGTYCRRAQEFSKLDKTYEVTMQLGQISTTGDEEGEKRPISDRVPSDQEVSQALKQFTGTIEQVPPAFSAIKVDGKRSYQLAREGKAVELAARTVTIHSIDQVVYEYPIISFTTSVSSGTYIRSLVEDIGSTLGTGAYTRSLRRTRVGTYRIEESVFIDGLSSQSIPSAIHSVP